MIFDVLRCRDQRACSPEAPMPDGQARARTGELNRLLGGMRRPDLPQRRRLSARSARVGSSSSQDATTSTLETCATRTCRNAAVFPLAPRGSVFWRGRQKRQAGRLCSPRPPRRRSVSEVDAVFRGSQGESRHSDAGACGQCRPSRHEACGSPREFPDRSKSNQIQPKNRGVRWSGVGRNSPERDSRKCIFTKRTHFAGPSPLEAGLRTLSTGSGLRLGASQVRGIKAFMIYHLGFSIWFQVSSTGAGTHHDGPDCPRFESAAEWSCNYLGLR